MDYNRLESLRKIRKFSQEELAQKIGFTKNGYQLALKNDTLKVKDLENISNVLEVSITYFFGETKQDQVNEVPEKYNVKCKSCERYEDIIDEQRLLIKTLQEKFNSGKDKKAS